MSVLYLLMAASLVVALGFLVSFIWAVWSGQFDDTETPSMRVLLDEDTTTIRTKNEEKKHT